MKPARPLSVLSWLATALLLTAGCGSDSAQTSAPRTESAESQGDLAEPRPVPESSGAPPAASGAQAAERSTTSLAPPDLPPAGPVGDDPAASLAQLAQRVSATLAEFDRTTKLIFPRGFHRERIQPLEVTSQLRPGATAEEPPTGIVHVQYQEMYSMIHADRDDAAADDELLPRLPKVDRVSMQNDYFNAKLPPLDLEVEYQARDGQWVRTRWTSPARLTKGADYFDQMGLP